MNLRIITKKELIESYAELKKIPSFWAVRRFKKDFPTIQSMCDHFNLDYLGSGRFC